MSSLAPHGGEVLGATPGHPLLIPALSQSLALSMSRQQALLTSVGIGQHPRWSPAQLFAADEVGAWYDPSDLTKMFQDRAGTTPVTADGQTVGLMLDKSQGLVLGPELVVNGDFSNGTTGWLFVNCTGEIVAGKLQLTSTTNGFCYVEQAISTLSAGSSVKVSVTDREVVGTTQAVARLYDTNTGSGFLTGYFGSNSSSSEYTSTVISLPTVDGTVYLRLAIFAASAAGEVYEFDNVSIRKLSGNHAVAPSDAACPLKTSTSAADWINYDAVDDVLNATFPSSLGSSCTVARANVGGAPTILTGQTIGTSFADSTDHAGLIIINRALTGQETTDVTAWLLAKGATA